MRRGGLRQPGFVLPLRCLFKRDTKPEEGLVCAENACETHVWCRCPCSGDIVWNFAKPCLWQCPWCAVIEIGTGSVYWDCQYPTFEACYHLGNILAGNRGFCNLNPWPGPSQVVPYKHPKRRVQY